MRCVIQRVSDASVTVDGTVSGSIGKGLLVYLGVDKHDTDDDLAFIVRKIPHMRIFPDELGKMNVSVLDSTKEILVVSQFTLCADLKKGHRPSFDPAASAEKGNFYYEKFIESMKQRGLHVSCGIFGASMRVTYTNEGPVTIILDSRAQ